MTVGRALVLLPIGLLLASAAAHAQSRGKIDSVRPEVHLGLGWGGGLGVGAGIDIAVVPEGFLPGVDDELALRPAGELMFDDRGRADDDDLYFAAVFTPQWSFYFGDEWSAFVELGVGLVFDRGPGDDVDLDFVGALGGRYHLGRRISFVLRLNHPFGAQLGLTF